MMSLRRSARLSVLPQVNSASLHQNAGRGKATKTSQPNGISKSKKTTPSTANNAKTLRTKRAVATASELLGEPTPTTTTTTTTPSSSSSNGNPFDPYIDFSPRKRNTHSTPPPLDRPVEPHRTNATLLTPHGSHLVAYAPPGAAAAAAAGPAGEEEDYIPSPSKTGLPRPTATTGTLLEQAVAHLIAVDPRLKPVIDQYPCPLFSPTGLAEEVDPFRSLVSSIIGQQVSGAAAKSIKEKFVALFNRPRPGGGVDSTTTTTTTTPPNTNAGTDADTDAAAGKVKSRFPTPEEVARCDLPTLRTAGLSQRKAEYIQGLAEKFARGELSAAMLLRMSDEELVEKLTAVRGLGRWSVEMFACFALKRIDVFSTGDLGVQRGCAAFIGRDVSKLKAKGGGKFKYMSERDMLDLAARFAPYRSLFMWYMWRIENVDVAVMNGS